MLTPTVCSVPRCPLPAERYGRCAEHALAEPRRRHQSTREWRRLREVVMQRAQGRCERCGLRPPVDVHHVDPMAAGGPRMASTARLLAVCATCHQQLHCQG